MPHLKPFRGIRYRQQAGEPAALMAPPYDVISPAEHLALCQRSPYNVVHLTLGERRSAHERMPPDWYDAAGARLGSWLGEGILAVDDRPAFYLYTETFDYEGRRCRRKLLVGALKLEPYEAGRILPHETTMPGPKADRLRLMHTCPANLSPILTFFPDPGGRVNESMESLLGAQPLVAFADEAGFEHQLHAVVEPKAQEALGQALDPLPLYIADGHHRYETALAYQHRQSPLPGERISALPCDFVLAACMSGADPGMVIRATHRMVAWEGGPSADEVLRTASTWFDIAPVDSRGAEQALGGESGTSACQFVVYGGPATGTVMLTLRDQAAMADSPYPLSSPMASLPAAVFRHGLIGRALGPTSPKIWYTSDASQAMLAVDDGAARLAGLLPAVRPPELMRVVDTGERMPPKSTYFWPKPLTGMVLRSLDRF